MYIRCMEEMLRPYKIRKVLRRSGTERQQTPPHPPLKFWSAAFAC